MSVQQMYARLVQTTFLGTNAPLRSQLFVCVQLYPLNNMEEGGPLSCYGNSFVLPFKHLLVLIDSDYTASGLHTMTKLESCLHFYKNGQFYHC